MLESPWVRLVLSGHDHMGGYAQHGHVHFVTVEAMLEGRKQHALMQVVSYCASAILLAPQ